MIELEILVEVYDSFDSALERVSQYQYLGKKHVVDTYYFDPLRPELNVYDDGKLYASFRIRKKDKEFLIAYKKDNYIDNQWQYSDEYETKIQDASILEKIIFHLGLEQLVVIDSEKYLYMCGDYEIVLEKVKGLGVFLEVELKKIVNEQKVKIYKKEIQTFINNLGLNVSMELNCGKPELLLSRMKKRFKLE